ncbi:hypothetical protein M409DRAFT_26728 [Zasmidium cellare ATCC 36951]|uniref:BTB domain-containing protein n=1 Tax=Zasmidium cellare ATCC 36951 TaxID=1080233 RepID=A0A6A6C7P6_ZASCE|nr:uncharacterized protein M409DRAFT_26728 [Zasmidium cellare ATCC 36951]KAF2162873.1 hypothetical protein M409DRAFT_26728 [Zasmidium cellare ATCC 36951]
MAYLDPWNEKAQYVLLSMNKRRVLTSNSYFNNPKFSDITIHFSGHEVKAHKVNLASHSGYFRKMFESESLDGSAKDIYLYEDDMEAVFGMLAYFYGCLYHGQGSRGEPSISAYTTGVGRISGKTHREHLKYLLKLHGVADKYGVSALMRVIKDEFEKGAQQLQARYTPFGNERCADELVSIFAQLATLLYHSLGGATDELRRVLAEAVHERTLELVDNEKYRRMVRDVPEFSVDLLELATSAMKNLGLQVTKTAVAQNASSRPQPVLRKVYYNN